jgi:hypothetical protein
MRQIADCDDLPSPSQGFHDLEEALGVITDT